MPAPHLIDATDDSVIDARIGVLLRSGVLISAAVILAGGVLYLLRHGHETNHYKTFHGVAPALRSLAGIVGGVRHGSSLAIIQLGLLLLIATPIARVAFSVAAFLLERDYLYVTVSMIVLLVLLFSLIWH